MADDTSPFPSPKGQALDLLALAQAERRVRRHRQRSIEDVPRFRIGVNAGERAFKRLMIRRYRRMLEIRSVSYAGRPVTPPRIVGEDTFHIIEVVGRDGTVLELLFREWDLYFVGFRTKRRLDNADVPWFKFADDSLPEWFHQVSIGYGSKYTRRVSRVQIGGHCPDDIFFTLISFKLEDRLVKSDQRERAIIATLLIFAEPLRLQCQQDEVKDAIKFGNPRPIGALLDKRIHGWSGLCRDVFKHEIDPQTSPLERACKYFGYNTVMKKGRCIYGDDLVGAKGDLLTLKFDKDYVVPLIIKRQQRAAEAAALWQPQEEVLGEISSMLEAQISLSTDQTHNWRQLQHYSQFPDFGNYLVFLLTSGEGRSLEVRQAAGLLLKNNLRVAFDSFKLSSQQYIKSALLPCIGATHKSIRSTVGTIISVLLQILGVFQWIDLLQALHQCLCSEHVAQMEGAMDIICKICEDIPEELDVDNHGLCERPINIFMPMFLQFFRSPHASLRKLALGCTYQYIVMMPSAMRVSMYLYLQGLFDLAKDPSDDVRELAFSSLVQLIKSSSSILEVKFAENECEKIDRLKELYTRYSDRVKAEMERFGSLDLEDLEMDDDERYNRKLEAGLDTLQLPVLILGHIWHSGNSQMRTRIELLLSQNKLTKDDVKDILEEYHDNIGDLDGPEEKERAQGPTKEIIAAL